MSANFPDSLDSSVGIDSGTLALMRGGPALAHKQSHLDISKVIVALQTIVGFPGTTDPDSLSFKLSSGLPGTGDMIRAVYDPNHTGTVLTAQSAASLSTPLAYSSLSGVPLTFPPSPHQTSHRGNGSDPLPLDSLALATDNVNLNASSSAHGLLIKLSNTGTKYLRDDGTWQTVAGGGGGAPAAHATTHELGGTDVIPLDTLGTPTDNTDLDASGSKHGLLPKLANTGLKFFRDDGTWHAISGAGFNLIDAVSTAAGDEISLIYSSDASPTCVDAVSTAAGNEISMIASP